MGSRGNLLRTLTSAELPKHAIRHPPLLQKAERTEATHEGWLMVSGTCLAKVETTGNGLQGGEPTCCHLVVTTAVGVQAVGEVGCCDCGVHVDHVGACTLLRYDA